MAVKQIRWSFEKTHEVLSSRTFGVALFIALDALNARTVTTEESHYFYRSSSPFQKIMLLITCVTGIAHSNFRISWRMHKMALTVKISFPNCYILLRRFLTSFLCQLLYKHTISKFNKIQVFFCLFFFFLQYTFLFF